MGVTSVRLNQKEEKLLKLLKNYYNCDASSLLKKSLYELYEDLKDKEIIERFEKKEKNKKPQFVKFEDLM
jgi:hypothetical protein